MFWTSIWHNGYVAGLPCSRLRFESQTQWFKLTPGACACMPKILRGEGIAAWPYPLGGDFSLSVSMSLSVYLASARAL